MQLYKGKGTVTGGSNGKRVVVVKGEREEIQWDTDQIKSHLRGHIEPEYSRMFLKCIHIWRSSKWNHLIMGETEAQLDISFTKWSFQYREWVASNCIVGQRVPRGTPRQPSLLSRPLITLYKLMIISIGEDHPFKFIEYEEVKLGPT